MYFYQSFSRDLKGVWKAQEKPINAYLGQSNPTALNIEDGLTQSSPGLNPTPVSFPDYVYSAAL